MTHTGDKIYCAISIEIDSLGTKALPKPILVYCPLDFKEQILVQFDQNEFFVYEKHPFENVVYKKSAILFRSSDLIVIKNVGIGAIFYSYDH